MERPEEIALLKELLGLKERKALFLDENTASNPVRDYLSSERFNREQADIFAAQPAMLAHSSELDGPNTFLRSNLNGLPLLAVRGDDGEARVFLNVCRHRGTRLVADHAGCRQRFSCPYHAWTWNSRGEFVGAPHFEDGFSELTREHLGLKALPCTERYGFIWLLPNAQSDLDDYLAGLGADLKWIDTASLTLFAEEEAVWNANWKLLVEGGLEAYHFRVTHRDTIARLFDDNLSSYQCFGPHFRSVLPRATLLELKDKPENQWRIRDCSNVLYTLFPSNALLVQSDHVAWIRNEPLAPGQTRIRVATLVPSQSERSKKYWQKNHDFTLQTLREDFEIAQSIQSGLDSGANDALKFGRYEGALARFNQQIVKRLSA